MRGDGWTLRTDIEWNAVGRSSSVPSIEQGHPVLPRTHHRRAGRFQRDLPDVLAAAKERGNRAAVAIIERLANAKCVRKATEVDLSGYRRGVDSFAVRHAMRNHGNHAIEQKRGQIGMADGDFELIPRIASRPDRVIHGHRTQTGREVVLYERALNGVRYHHPEEVRPERRPAMILTMWKRPAT